MDNENSNPINKGRIRSVKRTVSHSEWLAYNTPKAGTVQKPIKEIYAEWLSSKSWDYFFTGTFKQSYTCDGARRAGIRFFGSSAYKIDRGVLFIESGELYGRVHLHGLLHFRSGYRPSARSIFTDWFHRYGRARVEVPQSNEAVSKYCTKYVLKHAKAETYFFL